MFLSYRFLLHLTTEKEHRQTSAVAFTHLSVWHFINGDMYTTIIAMNVLVALYTVQSHGEEGMLYSFIVCTGSISGCTDFTVLLVFYSFT